MLTIEEKVTALRRELLRSIKENNDEQCLETSRVIFTATRSKQSFQYEIIASIRLGLYEEALDMLKQNEPWSPLKNELLYERAYCYYRTHQFEEAQIYLNRLKEQENQKNHLAILHLEAQISYAKENYENALSIYQEIKSIIQEEDDEIEANIISIKACVAMNNRKKQRVEHIDQNKSYEQLYNTACLYLGMDNLLKAKGLLELSRVQCNNKLNETDLSVEEKDQELMVIAAQLAYTLQLLGEKQEAKEIYESILLLGTGSDMSMAIASNNLVALNQHNSVDLFHSAKLLKSTRTSAPIYHEMKSFQKHNLLFNQALLQFHMKKTALCRKTLEQVPASVGFMLYTATEKDKKKRLELLHQYSLNHTLDIPIHLAYIQTLIESQKDEEALVVLLKLLRRSNMAGIIIPIALTALLIWLYQRIGKSDRAYDLLDGIESISRDNMLKKQIAAFNLKMKRYSIAARQYEALIKFDAGDVQSMAGLVTAYYKIDLKKAEKYVISLPEIDIEHMNAVELEYQLQQPTNRYPIKKKANIKKKKRKPLLPKNLNDVPDPERWLPKSERRMHDRATKI